jgi:hypothetical protein
LKTTRCDTARITWRESGLPFLVESAATDGADRHCP